MNDRLSEDTQAVLLLCGTFGQYNQEKPLSLTEYTSLVHWLIREEMRPRDLLARANIGEAAKGSHLPEQRLESLLDRGIKLGMKVEEWQRNGIWIISRSDSDYPCRFKQHLKDKAPPLLYGIGDPSLLNGGGLGIVGSRNVDDEGAAFTRAVAELCALNKIPVISGGARGVDQISMQVALEAGGITIGILADNLLRKSVERNARHAIAEERLLLISPYPPTAHFTVGNAMGRNKLIYALADSSLIVSAEYKKGGTWAGAEEELKRENSLPVFVRTGENVPDGNIQLQNLGATPCREPQDLIQQLANLVAVQKNEQVCTGSDRGHVEHLSALAALNAESLAANDLVNKEVNIVKSESKPIANEDLIYNAILNIVLNQINILSKEKFWASLKDLTKTLNVKESQMREWLKKAVEEGYIETNSRGQKYRRVIKKSEQYSFLK